MIGKRENAYVYLLYKKIKQDVGEIDSDISMKHLVEECGSYKLKTF